MPLAHNRHAVQTDVVSQGLVTEVLRCTMIMNVVNKILVYTVEYITENLLLVIIVSRTETPTQVRKHQCAFAS